MRVKRSRNYASRRESETQHLAVLEWRSSGHRLAYIAALARAAQQNGCILELYTDQKCILSDEYRKHLGSFDHTTLQLHTYRSLATTLHQALVIVHARFLSSPLILPEADGLLPLIWILGRLWLLPPAISIIVMRPPRIRTTSGYVKRRLLQWVSQLPNVRVFLLEDPLGGQQTPVWSEQLRRYGSVLYDPSDLIPIADGDAPPELKLEAATHIAVVVGGITPRKHIREVLDAWPNVGAAMQPGSKPLLVLAGEHDGVSPTTSRRDILHIDRYLASTEIAALLSRTSVLIALQKDPLSSGTVLAAAVRGIPVVALATSRLGQIARAEGVGHAAESLAPDNLADAIVAAFGMKCRPRSLPTQRDFAETLLQSLQTRGVRL